MDFDEYQDSAKRTDQAPAPSNKIDESVMLPLLGLAGETGSLLTHFKRYFRDGEGYRFFRQRIAEELGDILWNVSNIATKSNLRLEEIAADNLKKIQDRWLQPAEEGVGQRPLDEAYPDKERFPRQFEIEALAQKAASGKQRAQMRYNGRDFGDVLSDNAYEDDGYRHHDVFHLAFMTHLGWSPVLRGKVFFDCKRKSNADVDEVQDGGRATVIDEAIAALIFVEAKKNGFYATVNTVEYGVLRTIKELTSHLEVSRCTGRQWERAILSGFRAWRELRTHGKGVLRGDLDTKVLSFDPVG